MRRHIVVGSQRTAQLARQDAVVARVVHGEVSPDEERDVATRLPREEAVDVPEVRLEEPGALDGTIDVAGAAVIGRQHQPPVAVDLVEVLEEAARGLRATDGIHALIHEAIDVEPVDAARGEHQLPEASRPSRGDGLGIERRLDDDQIA